MYGLFVGVGELGTVLGRDALEDAFGDGRDVAGPSAVLDQDNLPVRHARVVNGHRFCLEYCRSQEREE